MEVGCSRVGKKRTCASFNSLIGIPMVLVMMSVWYSCSSKLYSGGVICAAEVWWGCSRFNVVALGSRNYLALRIWSSLSLGTDWLVHPPTSSCPYIKLSSTFFSFLFNFVDQWIWILSMCRLLWMSFAFLQGQTYAYLMPLSLHSITFLSRWTTLLASTRTLILGL